MRTVNEATALGSELSEEEGRLPFAGSVLLIAGVLRIFDSIWCLHYHYVLAAYGGPTERR
jgi:hypothetical protein